MTSKEITKVMNKLIKSISNDETLVPKAREVNKAINNLIKFKSDQIAYNKYRNNDSKIDLYE